MKLYYHPASTTSRAVMLGAEEMGIALEYRLVDLMTGAHLKPEYAAVNPNCLVPVLDDDGFRLTESSAILKYLADKVSSPAYPKDLQSRARVNESMDWINSNLYKDLGYGLVYPQVFPNHRRPTDAAQQATLAWAGERSRHWLGILDRSLLGSKPWLCGSSPTIADYFAAPVLTLLELVRADLSAWPNVVGWLGRAKDLRGWAKVNETYYGFVAAARETPFVAL